MSEQLHVGLLSLDKRKLLSPEERPALFEGSFSESVHPAIESQAKGLMGQRQIITSSEHGLISHTGEDGTVTRAYLLRESRRVNIDEHGLHLFDMHYVHDFLQTAPNDVRGYFLRQILMYMQ